MVDEWNRYFMFTYITTTTVPSFPQLQKLYTITYMEVNLTVAIPSFGLSIGPLFWSSLSDIYGRRVVFIVGTALAFVATIATAVSPTYSIYMASRFFQGFGVSPGGVVGMAIINEYVSPDSVTVSSPNKLSTVFSLTMKEVKNSDCGF
jgi:MFS family permease